MPENEQKDAPQLKLCNAEWTLMRHPSVKKMVHGPQGEGSKEGWILRVQRRP